MLAFFVDWVVKAGLCIHHWDRGEYMLSLHIICSMTQSSMQTLKCICTRACTHAFCKCTSTQKYILNTLEQMVVWKGDKRKEVRKKEKWEGRKGRKGTFQGQIILMHRETGNVN